MFKVLICDGFTHSIYTTLKENYGSELSQLANESVAAAKPELEKEAAAQGVKGYEFKPLDARSYLTDEQNGEDSKLHRFLESIDEFGNLGDGSLAGIIQEAVLDKICTASLAELILLNLSSADLLEPAFA